MMIPSTTAINKAHLLTEKINGRCRTNLDVSMYGDILILWSASQASLAATTKHSAGRNISGAILRQMRNARKLSQHQLAVKCQLLGWDIDRKLVSKIETGLREVTDADLQVLATALNVHVGAFFDMTEKNLKYALDIANRSIPKPD